MSLQSELSSVLRFVVAAQVVMILAVAYVVWDLEYTQDQLIETNRRQEVNTDQRIEAFCDAEFDIRLVLADTLTIIAQDPEDTTLTAQERRRRIANAVEMRLQKGLPEICSPFVNLDEIKIHTNGSDPPAT